MMGRKHREQANFFYEFRLDARGPWSFCLSDLCQAGVQMLRQEI
jgi:hypothetical protein